MKKTFLKSAVATAVVAAAVALSSVAVFAETLNMSTTAGSTSGIFSVGSAVGTMSSASYSVTLENGNTISGENVGYKLENNASANGGIGFTIDKPSVVTIVVQAGGSGTRNVCLYDSSYNFITNLATTEGSSAWAGGSYTIGEAGTYYVGRQEGKTMRLYYLDVTTSDAVIYDESLFDEATNDTTVYVPGSEVVASATATDLLNALGLQITSASGVSLDAAKEINGINFLASTSKKINILDMDQGAEASYPAGTVYINTGGKTNSATERTITYTAKIGDTIIVKDFATNSNSSTRSVSVRFGSYNSNDIIGTVSSESKSDIKDASFTLTKAGTYYITFDNSVNFTGIEVVSGVAASAPAVTLSEADTASYAGKVAFTGAISGNGSDNVKVTGINFAIAKGYKETKLTAANYEITNVYNNGSDYVFVVTIDADKVNALPGVKAQANVVTDCGTMYSNAVEYVPVTE